MACVYRKFLSEPYSAALISLSVPSTPTRKTLTSTPPTIRQFVPRRLVQLGEMDAVGFSRKYTDSFHFSCLRLPCFR